MKAGRKQKGEKDGIVRWTHGDTENTSHRPDKGRRRIGDGS